MARFCGCIAALLGSVLVAGCKEEAAQPGDGDLAVGLGASDLATSRDLVGARAADLWRADDLPPSQMLAEPMPRVSDGLPAFASSGNASSGNDADYDTEWRSQGTPSGASPQWLAYDLSTLSSAQRAMAVIAWYDTANYNWDYSYFPGDAYNLVRDYTIEINLGAGGGAPPSAGWTALATVTANPYHSRQHLVDLGGASWLRLRATDNNGSSLNDDVSLNLDVHAAPSGASDSWIFFGDSITAFSMGTNGQGIDAPSFADLVHAARPAYWPAQENAGIGGTKTDDAIAHLDEWLALFPGRFVCLSYGTNDVNGNAAGVDGAAANLEILAATIVAAGKRPCIPTLPWGPSAGLVTSGPALNAKIEALYQAHPEILRGPDLWTVFEGHDELFRDDLHPNEQGIKRYREAWAEAMVPLVY